MDVMLILRGIAGTFDGVAYPQGALDEASALAFADRMGYDGQVLDVDGATGPDSPQVSMALDAIRRDPHIIALYGFSGGGYNVRHIVGALTPAERRQLKLLIVLGAPRLSEQAFAGPWQLVYRGDPPDGHMAGPKALLDETER